MVGAIKNVIRVYYIFFYSVVWEIGNSSFIAFETSRSITFSLESERISNKKQTKNCYSRRFIIQRAITKIQALELK